MTMPEASQPSFPEIPWPKGTTPDNLAEIDSLKAQGNSIGAAVATFIIYEARRLTQEVETAYQQWQGSQRVWSAEHAFRAQSMHQSIWGFTLPAYSFLYAEEVIRNGELPFSIEDLQESDAEIRQWWDPEVSWGHDNPAQTSAKVDISAIEYYLYLRSLGTDLTKMTPPEVVDSSVNFTIQYYENAGLYDQFVQPIKLGLEKGRERFHTLYNAIQEGEL